MRKPLVVAALLAISIFVAGYVIGQIRGITGISAASSSNPGAGWHGFRHFDGSGRSFRDFNSFSAGSGTTQTIGKHADGQVTAINGNTVTIKPDGNNANELENVTSVVLTTTTQYVAGRETAATRDSIKVGSFIIAEGTVSSDGKTLTATRVGLGFAGGGHPGGFGPGGGLGNPHADGTVTSVNGNTVTIKPDGNNPNEQESVTTITLTTSTQYLAKPGATSAGKSDVKSGAYIIAVGTLSSDGKTLTATKVLIAPNGAPGGFARPHDRGAWFGGPPQQQDGNQPSA